MTTQPLQRDLDVELGERFGIEFDWLTIHWVAGLVLTTVLIPAGIGYAEVAGLPPVTGLYATIVPLLAYALLGPSRLLILGPDSSLVPLVLAGFLAIVFAPTVDWLHRRHVPRAAGAAIVILLLAFGSLIAMGLPIGMALFGLALGVSAMGLLAFVVEIPTFSPVMASMIGLGVGMVLPLVSSTAC